MFRLMLAAAVLVLVGCGDGAASGAYVATTANGQVVPARFPQSDGFSYWYVADTVRFSGAAATQHYVEQLRDPAGNIVDTRETRQSGSAAFGPDGEVEITWSPPHAGTSTGHRDGGRLELRGSGPLVVYDRR